MKLRCPTTLANRLRRCLETSKPITAHVVLRAVSGGQLVFFRERFVCLAAAVAFEDQSQP
jgi:hypothetical protein